MSNPQHDRNAFNSGVLPLPLNSAQMLIKLLGTLPWLLWNRKYNLSLFILQPMLLLHYPHHELLLKLMFWVCSVRPEASLPLPQNKNTRKAGVETEEHAWYVDAWRSFPYCTTLTGLETYLSFLSCLWDSLVIWAAFLLYGWMTFFSRPTIFPFSPLG